MGPLISPSIVWPVPHDEWLPLHPTLNTLLPDTWDVYVIGRMFHGLTFALIGSCGQTFRTGPR